jgi:hypothetical protein
VTNELLLRLTKESHTDGNEQLISHVENNVEENWTIRSFNSTLTFTSRMSTIADKALYVNFYLGHNTLTRGLPLTLTKLYFCENIRLDRSEFNITSKNIVFDKISNRTLSDAEYNLIESEGKTSCHVCIDGSAFKSIYINGSVEHVFSLGTISTGICALVIIFMNS